MPRPARLRRFVTLFSVLGLAVVAVPQAASWAAGTTVQATWHARQAEVYAAQAAGNGGAGVLVAVLDGWVDAGHKDFEGRARPGVSCLGGTCVEGQQRDSCWHGTHVAGLIGSSSFGVAPQALLLPVQVLGADAAGSCVGTADDVAAGIRYAVDAGARIVNLSLGSELPDQSASSPIPTAVQYAGSKDVLVVFSAGNNDAPVANTYGGGALIVAATAPSGRLASYSQHGQGISLAAPGGDGSATDKDGKPSCAGQADCVTSLLSGNRYGVAAGTSMAAPQVSGAAALLLGQDATRTHDQLGQRLTATARPLDQAGAGLLDASAALGVAPIDAPAKDGSPVPVAVASPTDAVRPAAGPAASTRPVPAASAAHPAHAAAAPHPAPAVSLEPASVRETLAPVVAPTSPPTGAPAEVVALRPVAHPVRRPDLPPALTTLATALLLVAGAAAAGSWVHQRARRVR